MKSHEMEISQNGISQNGNLTKWKSHKMEISQNRDLTKVKVGDMDYEEL